MARSTKRLGRATPQLRVKHHRPSVIDLFSGAGGLSLGCEQAGFDVLAAVEIDPIHAATHHFNFPYSTTICADIRKLSGHEILKRAGFDRRRVVDLIVGGAPCQGFSMIGQRAFDDPRNQLVKEFFRIVREIKPRAFVFENVKGLTQGKQRKFLDELIQEARSIDYQIILPWQVLNAAEYGVPQNRERLILIGVKKGISHQISYPQATTNHSSNGQVSFLSNTPTCFDALDDLPDVDQFPELKNDDIYSGYLEPPHSEYASQMRISDPGDWLFGHKRIWDPTLLTSSMQTQHTDITKQQFREGLGGSTHPISRRYKLKKTGVSNTLRAGTDSARGAFSSPRPVHYELERVISVREMARLHSFPDWFRLHRTKWHGARQIGNAVPPLLAYQIAKEVLIGLGYTPMRSRKRYALGDSRFIKMTLQDACQYWDIDNPIGKRNMKSGAKKRKQSEIQEQGA